MKSDILFTMLFIYIKDCFVAALLAMTIFDVMTKFLAPIETACLSSFLSFGDGKAVAKTQEKRVVKAGISS